MRDASGDEMSERIIQMSEERGDFVTAEDEFVYFWPQRETLGMFAAYELRVLADELDKRNEAWNKNIEEYYPL
jgi:hypothetical protein